MRFFLICIFLFGIFSKTLSIELETFKLADSLYTSGNFFQAAIEYERVMFYSKNSEEKNQALYQKALCYKEMGDFHESFKVLQRITLYGIPQNKRNLYIYETALMAFLSDENSQCERMLILLLQSEMDSSLNSNIQLLGALNYIMIGDFVSSKNYANSYLKTVNDTNKLHFQALEKLYSKKNIPRLKNEKTLNWIGIAPGFGQMYVGKVGEGLTNLVMNIAVFSFGVYQVVNGFYVTGYFVGTLSINKLYFGGRTRASNLLQATNKNKLVGFQNDLRQCLNL